MEHLFNGFVIVFQPLTFAYMVLGVVGGIIIGALPGMTASMGIILLLPLTYYLDPSTALIMLAGMYCGSMYGGSISAILIRTPGTPSAAATLLDGYPLTEQGQAGKAIGIAALGSFAGGLFSVFCLILLAPQLAKVALKFMPADYFMLAIFGLTIMASTSGNNLIKGLISGWFGLLVATVGIDGIAGMARFTFGIPELMGGFTLVAVLIGVFAVSQVLWEVESKKKPGEIVQQELRNTIPTIPEIKGVVLALIIGAIIGVFIGIIPGTGGAIACFLAYNETRRWSKNKEKFGRGSYEGIAAPEAANNATTGGALVPMLSLGVPGDVVTAVMLGALMLIGIKPGPMLFVDQPHVVYALFAGLIVIQFTMLFVALFSTRIFPYILKVPYNILMPVVMVLCVVGAYTLQNSMFDVLVALVFGVIGYFMRKYDYPAAPLVLGVVLGPMAEENLNRALLLSRNDWMVFIQSPISLAFLILSVVSIFLALYALRPKKENS
ncbi:MAG: tripartite tricarboxylate transporter permease [Syntrophomonadaceae bacterium]|nr:tripartite tricarboxylate transporter permease [Syntrophomonadaceae bacterium]